jgi:hypothetical protein
VSGEEFYGPGYEDSDRLPPDISKMKSLGWIPRLDVRTTFRDAMAYYLAPDHEERRQISEVRQLPTLEASANPF